MAANHIVLRYGKALAGLEDTIVAHQQVIQTRGAVLFGKIGRPFGRDTIRAINNQVEDDLPTYLFLAARVSQTLEIHRGKIEAMFRESPDNGSLVPDYYGDMGIRDQVASWFRLTDLRSDSLRTMRDLVITNTGRPVLSVLGTSRSSMFIVTAKPGSRITSL